MTSPDYPPGVTESMISNGTLNDNEMHCAECAEIVTENDSGVCDVCEEQE